MPCSQKEDADTPQSLAKTWPKLREPQSMRRNRLCRCMYVKCMYIRYGLRITTCNHMQVDAGKAGRDESHPWGQLDYTSIVQRINYKTKDFPCHSTPALFLQEFLFDICCLLFSSFLCLTHLPTLVSLH